MKIECKFKIEEEAEKNVYCCIIKHQKFPTNRPITLSGKHEVGHHNKDVKEIQFVGCEMLKIPQGLTKIFPNLEALSIIRSNLKNLMKTNLAEFKLLKRIWISNTLIEFLPGDLIKGFKNLEEISFHSNKLKIIEPNILDGLNNLKVVDFDDNPNYKTTFAIDIHLHDANATLEEVKDELNQVFLEKFHAYKDSILNKCDLKKKGTEKNAKNREKCPNQQESIFSDLKNLIDDEKFKDFKILVGDREFNVHKFLLTARSPTFAEIILNNPEVKNLNLVDIPVDIFEIILKFLYTNELPPIDSLNDLRIFAAAGRLKIEELKNFAATHAMNQIDGDNALEILKLSNEYEHNELRQKAFDEIKKGYPKIMFKDKWAMEPQFVENLIEKFKTKEEIIRMVEEEFQDEMLSD